MLVVVEALYIQIHLLITEELTRVMAVMAWAVAVEVLLALVALA
jgi:hypothetical protein